MPVSSAGIAGTERLAHARAGTIAARDIARLAQALFAPGPAQSREDAVALLAEARQLHPPLDRDAERLQSVDQQSLMLVLRKDLQERIGRQIPSDRLERQARGPL